jgi:hypothetical protein
MDLKKKHQIALTMGIKFFPEKYFTRYLSERTELFSHMTARPIFPEIWRRPLYATVAQMLGAMVMAAGCVSPGFDHQNQTVH